MIRASDADTQSCISEYPIYLATIQHNIKEWHEIEVLKTDVKHPDQGEGQQKCHSVACAQAHCLNRTRSGDSIHYDIRKHWQRAADGNALRDQQAS